MTATTMSVATMSITTTTAATMSIATMTDNCTATPGYTLLSWHMAKA